jgi:glutamate 5-kinase
MVVKLGSQLLTRADGALDEAYLSSMAGQVANLMSAGTRVTLVSSGAVACGLSQLKLSRRPKDLSRLQAVAAVGQRRLMDQWASAFRPQGLEVGQILLTREDIDRRTRFLHLRNTIHALHELGIVPIVNENDTVSTDELVRITFGDNDILAAMVARALRADLLVLLSVVEGIQDPSGKVVDVIPDARKARELVRPGKSNLGKGGMDSKLTAARMVNEVGEPMIVAGGRVERVLERIASGEPLGTFLPGASRRGRGRGRWIGVVRPAGSIEIDAGAARALGSNRSLLPAGVVGVEGVFRKGDVVQLTCSGRVVAQGLSNYGSAELDRIKRMKTGEVRSLLGESAYDEVVHRDNLILTDGA